MKTLLLIVLSTFTLTVFAQKPLRFKSQTLISNGTTEIKLKKEGAIGEVYHYGRKLIQGAGFEIKKGTKLVKSIEFGESAYEILGQTLKITNSFVHDKTPMKMITTVSIHGNGLVFDQFLEAKKGYELTAAQIYFDVETFEGKLYKIGGQSNTLLTRGEAKTAWNVFQQPKSAMSFTIGEDEGTVTNIFFKEMMGSYGITLPTGNKYFDDYIVKLTPTKPGRVAYYIALPTGGQTVITETDKKEMSVAPLKVINGQTIKNKRSLVRMKDVGLMGDVLHAGESLIKGANLTIKKNGKIINVPFAITKNSTVEENKLIIKNDFKYQGDFFKLTTTVVPGRGYVDFTYNLECPPSCEFIGATLFLNYQLYKGKEFKLDKQRFNFMTKEAAPEDWNYMVYGRPSKIFKAGSSEGTDFQIAFNNGTSGKMEMIVQKEGFFKDYMFKMYQSTPNSPLSFRLTLPFGGEVKLPMGVKENENQLINGGFETGIHDWGLTFDGFDTQSSYTLDETDKTEGNNSLRLDINEVIMPVQKKDQNVSVTSEFIKLLGSIDMTYSIDLKSNVEDLPVELRVNYHQTDGVANKGTIYEVMPVNLSKEWKRYAFNLQLPKGLYDAFSVSVHLKKVKPNTKVWLDAAQFTPGNKIEYTANKQIEIAGDTQDKFNLFEPNQEVELLSLLKNNTEKDRKVNLKMTVLDPDYYKVLETTEAIKITANSLLKNPIKNYKFSSDKKGAYRVYISIEENGKEIDKYYYSFGIVDQMKDRKLNLSSKFGLHMGGHRYLDAVDLASKIGYTWLRSGAFFNSWNTFQPQKGWYSEWLIKLNLKGYEYLETKGMTAIAQIGIHTPKWATSAPKGSNEWRIYPPKEEFLPNYNAYVKKMVEAYKGKVHAYEIWNEPNGSPFFRGTAKEFVPLLKGAYTEVKKADPNAEVLAFGLTHYGKTAQDFLNDVFKEVGSEYCDAVSFHPYTEGRLSPDRTHLVHQFDEINKDIKKYGEMKPLWATEFGFFNPQKGSHDFTPFKNKDVPERLVSEEEAARFYVQEMAIAFSNGTEKAFYFIFQEGDIANRWFHGFVGVNGTRLKSVYFAGATCVKNLDYTEALGMEQLYGDVSLSKFKKEGKITSLLWKTDGGLDVKIKTDKALSCEDINGNPFILNPVNGTVMVTIGEDPIYIKSDIPSNKIEKLANEEYLVQVQKGKQNQLSLSSNIDKSFKVQVKSGAVTTHSKENVSKLITIGVDNEIFENERYKTHLFLYKEDQLVGRLERVIVQKKVI